MMPSIPIHPAPTAPVRPRRRLHHIGGLLVVAGLGLSTAPSQVQAITEQLAPVQHLQTIATIGRPTGYDQTALGTAIAAAMRRAPGVTTSVSVVELSSGQRSTYGVSSPLPAASVAKLLIATDYLREVEAGRASLTEKVGGVPAQTRLQQMIQKSDNTAWGLLEKRLGAAQTQSYARSLELTSYDTATNTITTSDLATLLAQLGRGDLLNPEHRSLLYSWMRQTNNEEMIPRALPASIVYHKYGQLDGSLNDAAIVERAGRTYIVAIFTRGQSQGDYAARTGLIRDLAQAVDRALAG